jgi:WhiB family redox-sensing transcriptional regulator
MKIDTRLRVDTGGMVEGERDVDWRDKAECRGSDPELFFPYSRGPSGKAQIEVAKQVCADCPVISDCLNWALESSPMPEGVWGGTDEDERADIVRNRDKPTKRRYFRKEWR